MPFAQGGTKEAFTLAVCDDRWGNFRTAKVLADGKGRFNFVVPKGFGVLVSLELLGIVPVGTEGPNKDIDLYSDYGFIDEPANQYSESDVSKVYNLIGMGGKIARFDISSVFTQLQARHICGIRIDHNNVGGPIHYLGIRLRWLRSGQ